MNKDSLALDEKIKVIQPRLITTRHSTKSAVWTGIAVLFNTKGYDRFSGIGRRRL